MQKRKTLALIVMIALSLCAGSALAEQTLKIGVLGPFTGPNAYNGQQFKDAAAMAFEEVDYKIGDYKIELVYIDSQSDPAKALNAYSEAIESKGVQIGLLGWHSSVAVAIMDIVALHKIPHFFHIGGTPLIDEKWKSDPKYRYYISKGWPDQKRMAAEYPKFFKDIVDLGWWKPRNRNVALFGEDTDAGRNVAEGLKKDFESMGWKVVTTQFFPMTQTDFYPMLSKIKSQDAVIIAGEAASPSALAALVKQYDELGIDAFMVTNGLGWSANWYEMTGKSSNYVLDMIPRFATKNAKEWFKKYSDKFGYEPSSVAGGMPYDYTRFFIKACKRALEKYGDLSAESLFKIGEEEIITGKLTYGFDDGAIIMKEYKYVPETAPDPHISKDHFYFPVLQYMDGDARIVYPPDQANAKLEIKK